MKTGGSQTQLHRAEVKGRAEQKHHGIKRSKKISKGSRDGSDLKELPNLMGLEFKAITTPGNKSGHTFESWWFINSFFPLIFTSL